MGFKETIHRNVDQTSWPGKIPVTYRYTYGLAGERFFRAIKDEGVLLATRSPRANKIYCPPAVFCEETFDELTEWLELPGVGTLESFTICHEDSRGARQEPVVMGAIRIDGADTTFIHRVGGCDPEAVFVGMRVQVKFLPAEERKGHIDDIEFFEPTV